MAVLIVSGYPEDQYAINLLKAGPRLRRQGRASENLVSAVVAAAQGRRYVSPRIADKLAQGLAGPAADQPSHTQLSEREFQIFCKLACGRASRRSPRSSSSREDGEHVPLRASWRR
jgi:DNA-binding NarL/FixJ family response regulator